MSYFGWNFSLHSGSIDQLQFPCPSYFFLPILECHCPIMPSQDKYFSAARSSYGISPLWQQLLKNTWLFGASPVILCFPWGLAQKCWTWSLPSFPLPHSQPWHIWEDNCKLLQLWDPQLILLEKHRDQVFLHLGIKLLPSRALMVSLSPVALSPFRA